MSDARDHHVARPLGFQRFSSNDPSPVHLNRYRAHPRRNGGGRHNRRKPDKGDDGEEIILANGDSPVRLTSLNHHNNNNGKVPTDRLEEEWYGGGPPLSEVPRRYPKEPLKTALAAVYMGACMLCTAVALALVHEKRPETPPLPDQLLDRLTYQKWGLFGCEHLIQFQTVTASMVVLFHKHRSIVLRRVMLMVGALYLYRAVTLWVTAVPIADENYTCAPKVNGTISAEEVFYRAYRILTGFGLSVNGHHVYCGDYIYSGHTMTIIMGHLIVKEYTPKRLFLLHWLTWLVACTSVILLLISRGHYTVDVVLAYYVTTRVWAMYHTVVSHVALRQRTQINHFSRFWWFEPVRWMEKNVKPGSLPHDYSLPLPSRFAKLARKRMRACLHRGKKSSSSSAAAASSASSFKKGGRLLTKKPSDFDDADAAKKKKKKRAAIS